MTGPFVFFDIPTRDLDASPVFYAGLAGWTAADVTAGNVTVPLFTSDRTPRGGFTVLSADDERHPQGVPYLPPTDVDAAAAQAQQAGATLIRSRTDLPAGSVVVITDPGGATVVLWQDKPTTRREATPMWAPALNGRSGSIRSSRQPPAPDAPGDPAGSQER